MVENCERRISNTWGKERQSMRIHQMHPEIAPFHKELWWYGFSFDDGYLYRPEQPKQEHSFSLMDKNSELDIH
ncbi:MAG: hypothetical protein KGZ96_10605 [Clostridia bacterium]|jgi:hypothetical protein|nr:hypothetical protein [Clostridia bacterium]